MRWLTCSCTPSFRFLPVAHEQELASVPLLGQAVKLGTITSGGGVAVSATGESWEVIDGAYCCSARVILVCSFVLPASHVRLPRLGWLTGWRCLIPVSFCCAPSTEKSISAQDRATLIAQLSNAVQQEAVGLGATIVPGGRGKPKPVVQPPRPPAGALPTASMPGTGVVPGFPSLAFPIPGVIPLPGVVPSVPVGLPSRAILLKNMFDPSQETEEGWDLDIAEDVKEECEKHGPVLHVGVQKDSSGEVYVLFRYRAHGFRCVCTDGDEHSLGSPYVCVPPCVRRLLALCVCVSVCLCAAICSVPSLELSRLPRRSTVASLLARPSR
jgi:hypothetical protein